MKGKNRKFLLQVRSIKVCQGGHTCNLIANGRKVAFIAPGIFEWSSHGIRLDVLGYFAKEHNIKPPEPEVLADGWTTKLPLYNGADDYAHVEVSLLKWINTFIENLELAKAVKQLCGSTVLTVKDGLIVDHKAPVSAAVYRTSVIDALEGGAVLLNGLDLDEIMDVLRD